jgi:hypothetical protein
MIKQNLTHRTMVYEDLLSKMLPFDYRQLVMARNKMDNRMLMDHKMVMVLVMIAKSK